MLLAHTERLAHCRAFHIPLKANDERMFTNGEAINGHHLLGLFYKVMAKVAPDVADSLHALSGPKPFTIAPTYSTIGSLTGLRITTLTEELAITCEAAWQAATAQKWSLELATQSVRAVGVELVDQLNLAELAVMPPVDNFGLSFESPCTFKNGPGYLPMPQPRVLFGRAIRCWREMTSQLPLLQLPVSWIEWQELNIFISSFECLKTKDVQFRDQTITGFTGSVWFKAHQGQPADLSMMQALARLATFTGVGYKTAMGLGVVSYLGWQ